MALPVRTAGPDSATLTVVGRQMRRCTYRRLTRLAAGPEGGYEVSCLYPDRRIPLPLGDLDSSAQICAVCMAGHVFRPDED